MAIRGERRGDDAPNESAPGHDIPEPAEAEARSRPADPEAPNESAPGHHPAPEEED